MLYTHPRTLGGHLANGLCAVVIGCVFAFVGLNAASGCGQSGGACIGVHDLISPSGNAPIVLADRR
ncbi:MAG: hypothetical protein F8N37_25485 [Telmatospirillum sp.]|nr:hypothetical protein [Telmatospirillum sp.]